jgi:hypothetical protein
MVAELSKKYRLFIITNGVKSTQDGRFGLSPITKYFEKIFISEVIGAEKPSRMFFDAVESGIEGYCREKAIVIGDSLSSDIKGAINSGIDCIWYNPMKKDAPCGWNITYTVRSFDEILEICRKYDVTLSLGDGLRPGCLADASDDAQFAELDTLGELVSRCRTAGVQAMVEGPGHVPLDQIQENMERQQKICKDAPFYILGPVVIDCAPGYDHFVAGMGGMMGAYYGASMLCYVTPKEHLGLPNADDVRRGVVAFKIAAHAADVALHKPHCRERDDAISDARAKFDWEKQFQLALDPEWARELRQQALDESSAPNQHGSEYCTMCGPDFCSVRLSAKLKKSNKYIP